MPLVVESTCEDLITFSSSPFDLAGMKANSASKLTHDLNDAVSALQVFWLV